MWVSWSYWSFQIQQSPLYHRDAGFAVNCRAVRACMQLPKLLMCTLQLQNLYLFFSDLVNTIHDSEHIRAVHLYSDGTWPWSQNLGNSTSILLLFDHLGFLLNKKSKSFLDAKSISGLPYSALSLSPHTTELRPAHAVGLACSSKYFDFKFIKTKAVHVKSCDASDYAGAAWHTCLYLS